MITRLPRWVWIGGGVLAFNAGMVNVVGILGLEHQAITHLTGTTSMLGASISGLEWGRSAHLMAMIGSFVAGTVLSGFIIADSTLRLGRRYGVALFIESILLFVAVSFLMRENPTGDYFASAACGLQNAMASTYSGSVIRTTHLSGMLTDIGIFLGQWTRGIKVDLLRFRLYSIIIGGFLGGGIAGAWLFRAFSYQALYFPAGLTGAAAVGYMIYHLRYR